jgi:hypothetical protein
MVSAATTEEECMAHGFGCRVSTSSQTGLLWHTTKEECENCTGELELLLLNGFSSICEESIREI